MRILLLSRWFPYPPNNGSKIRILNLVQQLARAHEVALVAFGEQADVDDEASRRELLRWCVSAEVIPYRQYRPTSLRAAAGLFVARPRFLVDTYDRRFAEAVRDRRRANRPDVAILSQLDTIPYAAEVAGLPLVLEELETTIHLDACRQGSLARRLRARLTWWKLAGYLRRELPRFAVCTVVSEREKANLRLVVPGYRNVEVVPNAIDVSSYTGPFGEPEPNTLIFAGALTYHANLDAARFFLAEVYPIVRREVPEVTLRITGRSDGITLGGLTAQPGVHLTGYVPDIRPVVARSWASVVPLRVGGGTRLKILESMALGTPVVSTVKGAEGLQARDGVDILLAEGPSELAARIVEVLRSTELRSRLSAAGRATVSTHYDSNVVGERFRAVVDRASRGAPVEATSAAAPTARLGTARPVTLAEQGSSDTKANR